MNTKIFKIADNIIYGWGSLAHLKSLDSRRALILSGNRAMQELGILQRVIDFLGENGCEIEVITNILPEPPIEALDKYLETAMEFQPDTFIALGGGSVIDSTKALWALYEHTELDKDEIFLAYVSKPYPLPNIGRKARMVAIPSTSGTGSETSGVSILVETKTRIKRVLLSGEITPNIAIIDPEIPANMPPPLTANSGMDALIHALESIISPWSNDFSEPLAMRALELIFQNIKAAYEGSDEKAREKMHYASTLAGMAINNSITGLAHGMDKIGQHFDLPHGLTCAVLLPYTIAFNAFKAKGRYAWIAKNMGLEGGDEVELTTALLKQIVNLISELGIPHDFQEMGIEKDEYIKKLDLVSEYALKAGPTVFSPVVPTKDELNALYMNAFYGILSI